LNNRFWHSGNSRGRRILTWQRHLWLIILVILGSEFVFSVPGRLNAAPPDSSAIPIPSAPPQDETLLGFVGLIISGLLLWGGFRIQRARSPRQVAAERQRLIQQIARLDDQYAQGQLASKEYQAERDRLKGQALVLTRALYTHVKSSFPAPSHSSKCGELRR
jgi:hypothetical protein